MRKILSIIILLTAFAFSNCKKPTHKHPEETKKAILKISFNPMFNGTNLVRSNYGQTVAGLGDVSVITWSMITSNMHLVKSNGEKVKLGDGYGYFDVLNTNNEMALNLDNGDYVGFGFDLGVDSATNHSDPAVWGPTHPLNVNINSMHWGWAGGYIFNVFEGAYKTSSNVTPKGFSYHMATMEMLSPFSFNKTISLKENTTTNLSFAIDTEKLFAKMDIANEPTNHSMTSKDITKQKEIVNAMKTAFKLQ